jgi:type I restriction enzyme S subunit
LEEQKRIVAILDEAFEGIDAAIANTQANLAAARELFDSYLGRVFVLNSKHWHLATLEEVCFKITDGKHGDCENEQNSGYYFLSAKDVKNGFLQYENAREITQKDFEETHRRTDLSPGDILLTNAGTIGRTAIALENEKTKRTTFQKSVAILKPKRELIDSRFCLYALKANLRALIDSSSGTAQKNLLLRDTRSFQVPLPKVISEQVSIAKKLEEFEKKAIHLESLYEKKLDALHELKQSILAKAFRGELTREEIAA